MNRFTQYAKKEWETFRHLRGKERLYYIWDYYKIPIGAIALVIALALGSVLYSSGNGKVALHVMLLNANNTESTLFDDMLARAGCDTEEYHAEVTDTYTLDTENGGESDAATMQVLAALFAIGDMDLFAANEGVFQLYAAQNGFENIGLLLPQELQQAHAEDLYCYTTEDGAEVVGGIWLREGSALHKAGYYTGDVLIGVATQAENLEYAVKVVEMLLAQG